MLFIYQFVDEMDAEHCDIVCCVNWCQ